MQTLVTLERVMYFGARKGSGSSTEGEIGSEALQEASGENVELVCVDEANELMNEIHHRMPVILHPEDYGKWLAPDFDEKEPLRSLLKPYPSDKMEAYTVGR
ncbi:MAG: SOS response-associated peptidase, partial [Actinobacteria bacterium]|nr:SOS response-associated peptidase [Actinomycetota bacterium]